MQYYYIITVNKNNRNFQIIWNSALILWKQNFFFDPKFQFYKVFFITFQLPEADQDLQYYFYIADYVFVNKMIICNNIIWKHNQWKTYVHGTSVICSYWINKT